MTLFDVAVVGLGPAGRSLAHRLAAAGLEVLGVDPHPGRSWAQTLGGWRRQLPAWLPADVVATTAHDPQIRAADSYPIRDEYAILDNDAVRLATTLERVTVEEQVLGDDDVAALRQRARMVVDARGARPAGSGGDVPHQTAHGILVPPEVAEKVLCGAEAVLMDWRPFDGAARWGVTSPTFLYVIPMPDGRVLLEETCLAGAPGLSQGELRRRLLRRLELSGLGGDQVSGAEVERVSIPLVRRGGHIQGVMRFGAAGQQNNPFSGYTFFASLSAVDGVVAQAVRGELPGRDQPLFVRRRALHGVLNLSPDDTYALFDAFGRLSPAHQRAVLDADTPGANLVAAMARQFTLMPLARGLGLARATLLP
ncbi:lycopene cyclase family protein [Tessaracoccus antarcticus]|uniref:lycopene cyclase family protein n=1 Tax=Tessaracoccus antarcticus TaxID=2479848 RepID=UPI001313EEAE|nr:lycopene cyclase family protein [Tessaracoccus antarcticus]